MENGNHPARALRAQVVRGAVVALVCLAFALLAARQLKVTPFALGVDDADISLVYARHLVEGHGLVYNPGGERVEGFTSLLWVLVAALPFRCGVSPEGALFGLNLVMLASVLTLFTRFIDRRSRARAASGDACQAETDHLAHNSRSGSRITFASLFFLGITLGAPAYVAWTTVTLMDLGLWSTLLAILTVMILDLRPAGGRIGLSIALVLLVIARPEAMVWGPAFLVLAFGKLALLAGRRRALRFIVAPLSAFVLSLAALTLFRILYFGYPLPNTYYAKVSSSLAYNLSTGFRYLADYSLFAGGWVTVAILASVAHAGLIARDLRRFPGSPARRSPDPDAINGLIVSAVSWIGLGVPVLVGGDYFGGHRMYQAIYPILALNIILLGLYLAPRLPGSRALGTTVGRTRTWTLSGMVFVLPLLMQGIQWKYFSITSYLRTDFAVAQNGRTIGSFMSRLFRPLHRYPRVGVFAAGGFKRLYEGPILDVLGLNDTAMGHSRGNRQGLPGHGAFDASVFFSKPPEVMIPYIDEAGTPPLAEEPRGLLESGANVFLKGLYGDPEFRTMYVYGRVRSSASVGEPWLRAFFLKDFLEGLRDNESYQVETAGFVFGR
jgi:hypothetical protein